MLTYDPVDLLESMVGIASPSASEAELAGFLAEWLGRLGRPARIDAVGNLVFETGTGDGPAVLCLGHLDTVDDPIPTRRRGGMLWGRGSVDAKSALAAMVCAALALPEFPGRLIVVGAVEEEVPASRGARYLASRLAPQAVVVGEPGGWDRVTVGYKGQVVVEVRLSRPGSHASHPAENAAEAAARIWQAVAARFSREQEPGGSLFDKVVAGASALSADRREARLLLDFRVPPGVDPDGVLEPLRRIAGPDARLQLIAQVPGIRQPRSGLVAVALAAAIHECGGRPRHVLKGGTSDLNIVAPHWQVPIAAYGPGDSRLDHTPDERIDLGEYLRSIEVLRVALQLLGRRLNSAAAEAAVTR